MLDGLSFYSYQYLHVLGVLWTSFQILEPWGLQSAELGQVTLHGKICHYDGYNTGVIHVK